MNLTNPLLKTRDHYQHLSWKHLKNGTEYHLELIHPLKGVVRQHSEMGAYWTLAAEVLDDSESNILSIQKGAKIVVDLTVRTFERAWVATSMMFRQGFKEEHNLRIKFIKKSKQSMFIMEVEKLVCSPDQHQFANEVYSNVNVYAPDQQIKKPRIRESEYL